MNKTLKTTFLILLLLPALAAGLSAQNNSYIALTVAHSGEELYFSDSDLSPGNKKAPVIEFKGVVSKGTDKVVVLYYRNSNQLIEEYTLSRFKPGDREFTYRAASFLNNLNAGSNYYEFRAYRKDGTIFVTRTTLYVYRQQMAEKAKPVIYLYPTHEMKVEVTVSPREGLTESIPEMGDAWKVTATPDGTIVAYGKEYPYLFWESRDNDPVTDISEGFCVKGDDIEFFFRQKLIYLGLNAREIDDFLEYWLPEMGSSPWFAIRFVPRIEQDADAPLSVIPAPDSIIRVYFEYLPLQRQKPMKEQDLNKAERSGFAVIEWGGRKLLN